MTKSAARRVASEYWVSYGYENTRVQAATSLEMVYCVYFFSFGCLLSSLLTSISFLRLSMLRRCKAMTQAKIPWPGPATLAVRDAKSPNAARRRPQNRVPPQRVARSEVTF